MLRTAIAAATAAMLAFPAGAAQTVSGLWSYHFQNGVGEYLTGQWDSPTGGALNLSCLDGGKVAVMAQIKGKAPPPNSVLRLSTSSRTGIRESRFATGADGTVNLVASSPDFARFWANLRADDIVTLRYPDGRTSVQSLAGARKLLPVKPCG